MSNKPISNKIRAEIRKKVRRRVHLQAQLSIAALDRAELRDRDRYKREKDPRIIELEDLIEDLKIQIERYSMRKLADEYGISQTSISNMTTGVCR